MENVYIDYLVDSPKCPSCGADITDDKIYHHIDKQQTNVFQCGCEAKWTKTTCHCGTKFQTILVKDVPSEKIIKCSWCSNCKGFGYIKKATAKDLQIERNQLNRQISTLKKAQLRN